MDQSLPMVTMAIPTYNRANSYLPQALKSALNQTYPQVEIIVSDNCSSDHTEQCVKSFADPRIRYFKQSKNIGANNNGNFCVEKAQGSYLLMLHDDDVIDDDFIETCMKAANYDNHVGVIRTGLRLIDSRGEIIGQNTNRVGNLPMEEFILGWFDGKVWPYLCNTLFNVRGLQGIGGFKSKHNLFQDVLAGMVLASRFGRLDIEEIKASARKHGEELTFSANVADWCGDSLELLDLLCELAPNEKLRVRHEGRKFFSLINYTRVRTIRSPLQRIPLYMMVFRKFNYAYSPIPFILRRNFLFGKVYSLARRAKRLANRLTPG